MSDLSAVVSVVARQAVRDLVVDVLGLAINVELALADEAGEAGDLDRADALVRRAKLLYDLQETFKARSIPLDPLDIGSPP